MSDLSLEKKLALPISESCYMVSMDWWKQFTSYYKNSDKPGLAPGIIYNLDLVDLKGTYANIFNEKAEDILIGKIELNKWNNMELKHKLKEGEHFVLVGEETWKFIYSIYKAVPEIKIFVVHSAPASENFLKTPYLGGYPDLSPIHIQLEQRRGLIKSGIDYLLVSSLMTSKHFYAEIRKRHKEFDSIKLCFKNLINPQGGEDGKELLEDEKTLAEHKLQNYAYVTVSLQHSSPVPVSIPKARSQYAVFQEELFDGLDLCEFFLPKYENVHIETKKESKKCHKSFPKKIDRPKRNAEEEKAFQKIYNQIEGSTSLPKIKLPPVSPEQVLENLANLQI